MFYGNKIRVKSRPVTFGLGQSKEVAGYWKKYIEPSTEAGD